MIFPNQILSILKMNPNIISGTPLPTSSLPTSAHQGPVMLTSKNLQCMRAILSVAHCHGECLLAIEPAVLHMTLFFWENHFEL